MTDTDTICAIATPPGFGGVGIVRISGPGALAISQQLCDSSAETRSAAEPVPRLARFSHFLDAEGERLDTGLLLYFPAPHSFTGEDVVELQGHGGPVVLDMLLRRALQLGARQALPGEFSQRAFLNDKLDLTQAEAIADLVSSATESAARAAQRSLSGAFSARIAELQAALTSMRVFVEAAIDFPEEEIDFLADSDIVARLEGAQNTLLTVLAEARQGRLMRDGAVLAIIGRPNAGKSSLMNALSGQDSAIVTEIPGTTRDVVREWINLDGIPVHMADTAGIRDTSDPVEAEGVRRARATLAEADLVLLVIDPLAPLAEQWALLDELPDAVRHLAEPRDAARRAIVVCNKSDLRDLSADGFSHLTATTAAADENLAIVSLSALTGEGLDELKTSIRQSLGAAEQTEGGFSARQRHVDALKRAGAHLELGHQRLCADRAPELLAEELRLAQQDLGEITGEMLPDDLLGVIFSSFCIGK